MAADSHRDQPWPSCSRIQANHDSAQSGPHLSVLPPSSIHRQRDVLPIPLVAVRVLDETRLKSLSKSCAQRIRRRQRDQIRLNTVIDIS